MGYRSQVCVAIEKELFETKGEILKTAIKDCDLISLADKIYYLYWNGVKWYDGYEDITIINKFVDDNLEDTYFIRIGEDTEDIEVSGGLYCRANVISTIDFPQSKPVNLDKVFAPVSVKFMKMVGKKSKKKVNKKET